MSAVALLGAAELGLVFALVALGVFLSFRVLDFPDLTVDGSFPLGAAVAATLILAEWNPWAATGLAMLAGAASGIVTATLNVRFKILHLLASILTMIALFSVNLRVMGRPNVAILIQDTVLTPFYGLGQQLGLSDAVVRPLFVLVVVLVVVALLARFLTSEFGLAMRATGVNARMARAQGVSTDLHIYVGMALSNALVGLGRRSVRPDQRLRRCHQRHRDHRDRAGGRHRRRDGRALAGHRVDAGRLRRRLDPVPHRDPGGAERRFHRAARLGPEPRDGAAGGGRADPAARAQSPESPLQRGGRVPMITAKNLHVTFGRGTPLEKHALRGVDLAIPSGQFVTVIGSNGAGKSTVLGALAGDVIPDRGTVAIDDTDVTRWNTPRRAGLVARVFQDPMAGTCATLSIEENMALAAARGRRRGLGAAVGTRQRAGFAERIAELGLGLENRLKDQMGLLSGGQRQAVSLLMATLAGSRILLLDEHTAALDPSTADFVLDLTRRIVVEHGLTTLMVTHSMRHALDYGDRTIMLHEGQVVLDVGGQERAGLDVPDLLAMFSRVRGQQLADDALLIG